VERDPNRLKAIPLFASLGKRDLDYVAQILKWPEHPCPPEAQIIKQGTQNDRFFIIVDGEVRLIRDYGPAVNPVGLGTLKKYDFFGETGLMQDKAPNATVEAVAQTTYFYIEKPQFVEMLTRLPGVKRQIERAAFRRSKGMRFQNFPELDTGEVALWVSHHALIPMMWESLPGLVILNGLAFVLAVLAFFGAPRWGASQPALPWFLGAGAVVLFTVVWSLYWVDWTNDYIVLTNERIIRKEVFAFVRELRQEVPIGAVQDVSLEIRGPVFNLLRIADITITTIGGRMKFEHLGDAEELKESILGRLEMIKLEAKRIERDSMRQELYQALRKSP
jgi:membrane protein YdbS with pleckstrin-like domain